MVLTRAQRRTLVGLACVVARADGVVTAEEEEMMQRLTRQYAGSACTLDEMEAWLADGVPACEALATLPESLGQMFFYQAMELSGVDGDISEAEEAVLEAIMTRYFKQRPGGVKNPLGRITLKKVPR